MDAVGNWRVICDYERKDHGELSLKVGDVVEVLKKGKYIWYGRLKDAKGFFPSKVVEIDGQTSNEELGNSLSSTAVVDKEKTGAVDSAVSEEINILMNTKNPEETFKEIEPTAVLENKRRPRSAGRPPSQVFIKENILQRSDSMENLDNASDDEGSQEQQQEKTSTASTKMTSVSQLVMEIKQKSNVKSTIQKDAVSSSTTTVEHVAEGPTWIKALPKKKISVPEPIQKLENTNTVPPWLQEVRKRKEHKLSLKGEDDVLRKLGQEFASSQENKLNRTSVEIKGKTRTTNHVITEETRNIQTKSIGSEIHEEHSTSIRSQTTAETKVNQTSSSSDSNLDKNPLAIEDLPGTNIEKVESSIETQSNNLTPGIKSILKVVVTEVTNSPNSASHTNTNSPSTEQSKCIKDANINSEKIEQTNATKVAVIATETSNKTIPLDSQETLVVVAEIHPEHPKLSIDQSTKNNNTNQKYVEHPKDTSKEKQSLNLPQLRDEKQIANSLRLLINQVETFEAQYKSRSSVILEDIKKLEASLNRQNQETKKFIEEIKAKVSALAETKQ